MCHCTESNFSKDARVTDVHLYEVRPEKPAGSTKTEIKDLIKKATDAAYLIKFVPATKDGHPVSMWMQLEYSFSLDEEKDALPVLLTSP